LRHTYFLEFCDCHVVRFVVGLLDDALLLEGAAWDGRAGLSLIGPRSGSIFCGLWIHFRVAKRWIVVEESSCEGVNYDQSWTIVNLNSWFSNNAACRLKSMSHTVSPYYSKECDIISRSLDSGVQSQIHMQVLLTDWNCPRSGQSASLMAQHSFACAERYI
jgi:hypothetical protein